MQINLPRGWKLHDRQTGSIAPDKGLPPVEEGHSRVNAGSIQNATPLNLV